MLIPGSKTIRLHVFIAVLMLLNALHVTAQNNPYQDVSIASPNAAALGKYGDIPVSYHTGIPNISVPIYDVKSGPLQLSVNLSYHAAGLKVMEPSSWVGAGWSLNAGGVITRTVEGAPDEKGTSSTNAQNRGHFSDYGYNSYLLVNTASGDVGVNGDVDYLDFGQGRKDGEPDMFFFNFGGYSGKFYFKDDRTPIIVPEQDVQIIPSYSGTGSIGSFTIITPDGTKYYFGKTASGSDVDPIETTNPFNSQSGYIEGTVISSWFLNKVSSFDDQFSINLAYVSESYSYYTIAMFPLLSSTNNTFNSGSPYEYGLIKNFVKGVRLNQITFNNGSLTFNAGALRTDIGAGSLVSGDFTDATNTEAKTLGSIDIADNNNFCKKYNFYYSYFTDPTTSALPGGLSSYTIQTDKKRLKLDSLKEQSCDVSIVNPPYKFSYDAPVNADQTQFLKRRLSFAQDHWGFYNGATNTKLIPTYTIDTFTYINGANRESKWPEMKYGILNKITYPTGGYTQMDFEPNTTWISCTKYNPVFRFGPSVGYDGNNTSTTQQTFTSNSYTIILSNNACPVNVSDCTAGVNILDASNHLVFNLGAAGSQTASGVVHLAAGTYTINMSRNATQTGTGAQANFTENVPYNYQKNDSIGGLRIKTLTKYDGISTQNNNVTSYSYDANGQSSGRLFSRPVYVQVLRTDLLKLYGSQSGDNSSVYSCSPNGCFSCDAGATNEYYISPNSIRPMETTQGNHIGYDEVKVSQSTNGYSIYRYYGSSKWDNVYDDIAYRNVNPKPPCKSTIPSYPPPPAAYDSLRGELKYEGHFDEWDDVLNETYYYPEFKPDLKSYTPAFIDIISPLGTFTKYTLRSCYKSKMTTIQNVYSLTGSVLTNNTQTNYESPYHHMPTKTATVSSKGDSLITKMKYSYDFRIPNCDTISDCYSKYITDSTTCYSQYVSSYNACTTMGCRYTVLQNYMKCMGPARANYVTCRRSKYTDPTNAFSTCFTSALNAANVDLKPILQLQNDSRYPVIEVSNWRGVNLTSASFYKYDYATSPASEVYINKAQAINVASTATTFTASSNTATAVTKDSRYEDEGTYKFLNGNPAEAEGRDGVTKSYIWDYSNSSPVAVAINTTSNQIAYSSFEADGKGNWNYSGTVTTATTATTMPPTGNKYYNLTTTNTISKTGLTSGKIYVVSYWSKNGIYSITGGTNTSKTGKLINSWTYYEHTVTATGTTITVSGTGAIDEVRLYPSDAQMTTYTYQPLIGMTSQCDVNNRISYYEYDALARLRIIKDQDKNVLKKFYYNYSGQATTVDPPANFTVTISNVSGATGFTVMYTNQSTSTQYTLSGIGASGGTLVMPAGVYNVTVTRTGGNTGYDFTVCGSTTNCGVAFNSVSVNAGSCNTLIIDSLF